MPPAVYALVLASFAVGTQGNVFGGLLAEMAADLRVSVGTAGLAVALNAVTFAVCAPAAAILFARWDRRRMLVAGLLVVAAANAGAALAPDATTLLMLRVLGGLGAALVGAVNAAATVALAPPERRGRALALVVGGVTLAFVVGLPAGSALGGAFGWRACFVFAAAVALVAAGLLWWLLPALPGTQGARPGIGPLLRRPAVAAGWATSLLLFTATFCIVAFTGPLVNRVTGAAGGEVGLYQLFIGLGGFAGLALGGRGADGARAGALLLVLAGSGVLTSLWYAALLAGWGAALASPLLIGAIFVSAAALFAMIPLIQARLAAIAGAATPLALALNGSFVSFGQGLGAAIGGAVAERAGFVAAAVVGAAIAGAAVATAARVHRGAAAATR